MEVVGGEVEGVDGGVLGRGVRIAIPESEIVEGHEGRGVACGGVGRAVGRRHATPHDAAADIELDIGPLAGSYRLGKRSHAVRRDRNEEAVRAALFEQRVEHVVVRRAALAEAQAREASWRRVAVWRDVAREADCRGRSVSHKPPSAEIDGCRRVRFDEKEGALAVRGH